MLKFIYFILGSLSLGIGILGIFIPGLPTTPFLLLSAWCYFRSSERLYIWISNHKVFGKFISEYQKDKSLSKQTKVFSLILMWLMISVSIIFFVEKLWVQIIIAIHGMIGTYVMGFKIKTRK